MNLIRREPALVVSLASAGLSLGVAFGLPLSVAQKGAIVAVLQIAAGLIVRARVSPVQGPAQQD